MSKDIRIVVLQRGWVVVGEFSKKDTKCFIKKGAVVQRWGTTKGLPELAASGPLSNTILNSSPDIEFHELTEVFNIKCNPEKWESVLK